MKNASCLALALTLALGGCAVEVEHQERGAGVSELERTVDAWVDEYLEAGAVAGLSIGIVTISTINIAEVDSSIIKTTSICITIVTTTVIVVDWSCVILADVVIAIIVVRTVSSIWHRISNIIISSIQINLSRESLVQAGYSRSRLSSR